MASATTTHKPLTHAPIVIEKIGLDLVTVELLHSANNKRSYSNIMMSLAEFERLRLRFNCFAEELKLFPDEIYEHPEPGRPITKNYAINMLCDTAGGDTVNWFEKHIGTTFALGERYKKDEVFEKFKKDLPEYKTVGANRFTSWIKEFCRIKKIGVNTHKPGGGIDKEGITYFWTFTNESFK